MNTLYPLWGVSLVWFQLRTTSSFDTVAVVSDAAPNALVVTVGVWVVVVVTGFTVVVVVTGVVAALGCSSLDVIAFVEGGIMIVSLPLETAVS
ncbi:MAG: hypothetical protein B6D77_04120 [gamma proteobacterium symbiont of Ctena orbiculata]|nr:MAG: hypothetical protein B6D77_04120 [gamma proteobacterium symbiont of Ctena orbiculata]